MLLEGERESEVVELSMLAKEEGLSEEATPGDRNLGKWAWLGAGGWSPVSSGSYTSYTQGNSDQRKFFGQLRSGGAQMLIST